MLELGEKKKLNIPSQNTWIKQAYFCQKTFGEFWFQRKLLSVPLF